MLFVNTQFFLLCFATELLKGVLSCLYLSPVPLLPLICICLCILIVFLYLKKIQKRENGQLNMAVLSEHFIKGD